MGDIIASYKSNEEIYKKALEWFGGDELRTRVFLEKYALRDYDGNIIESTPEEMWDRVAKAIASVEETEEKREEWYKKFRWMLEDFKVVPGGRILFGAGNNLRKVTLLNCYVIPIKEDSIEGIFEWMKESARTYSYGGGVGVDISVLRPAGSPVANAAYTSTGAVSFMDIFSTTTGTIGQAGRRGALLISIHVEHPDVESFITIKNDPERKRVRYANISVLVSDDFMKAVEEDKDWELWYPDLLRKNDLEKEFGTANVEEILKKLRKRQDFVELDISKRSFYEFPWATYFYATNVKELRKKRVYKKVRAREIWEKLVKNAWASAEPGILFISTIKRRSTSEYNDMYVLTTNPCGEIPLEPYGNCCLSNVNLARFVKNEYTEKAEIDWENLEKVLRYNVRFLDNVLTYNADKHPLKQQSETSLKSRRIGVGFTGLADMLVKMRIKYDTEEALQFVDSLFKRIREIVYDESVNLAKEKGPFPSFDPQKHLESEYIKELPDWLKERIKEYGLRNAALLTVPPVGSGSILAGTSSGIEPIFAISYIRRSESLEKKEYKVYHPTAKEYMEKFNISDEKDLPDFFVTAHQIDPFFRVKMQGIIQKYIDQSISSTVNLPENITPEEIENIYMSAWKSGCKGITVYREGSREGVLITKKKEEKKELKEFSRPRILEGETVKLRTSHGNLYVTVNWNGEGIKEVFVNLGKSGADEKANAEAIGRLISIYLQMGGDLKEVIKQLKDIKGEEVFWDKGIAIYSIPDGIAKAIEIVYSKLQTKEIEKNDNSTEDESLIKPTPKNNADMNPTNTNVEKKNGEKSLELKSEPKREVVSVIVSGEKSKLRVCPVCGQKAMVFEGGCWTCRNCGYSKCE